MKIDYKSFNVKDLGSLFVIGILLLVVVALVTMFISPMLTTLIPSLFATPLGLTDTLLFLILITLVVKR